MVGVFTNRYSPTFQGSIGTHYPLKSSLRSDRIITSCKTSKTEQMAAFEACRRLGLFRFLLHNFDSLPKMTVVTFVHCNIYDSDK